MERIPNDFHSQVFGGHLFPALVLWLGKPRLELRPHASQGEPLRLKYPSGISAATPERGPSPLLISARPACPDVASSVDPWLQDFSSASLQLVFQVVALYFRCDSSLGLGGGECDIHLLHQPLGSPSHNFFNVGKIQNRPKMKF